MIREMNSGVDEAVNSILPTTRSMIRLAVLLLLSCAIFSISGCTGIAGTPNSSSQNQNTPAAAAISLSPMSITFGSVAVGGTVSQSVTLSNGGGANLTVTQASTAASGFTITGAPLPMTIAAGKQTTFNIVFSPNTTGAVTGTVSVMSNAANSPSNITVSATGVTATALLNTSTASLSFGNVSLGASSPLSVILSNAGNSNVTISSVVVSGAGYSASGVPTGLILAPGQTAPLNVTLSPSTAGNLTGSVTVASNATNSPASISLSGTGVQAVTHSVTLAWTATISVATGYNVYRSTASGGPYIKLNSSTVDAVQYTDSTVQGGQAYYYVVTAVTSGGGESSYSMQVSVVVPTS